MVPHIVPVCPSPLHLTAKVFVFAALDFHLHSSRLFRLPRPRERSGSQEYQRQHNKYRQRRQQDQNPYRHVCRTVPKIGKQQENHDDRKAEWEPIDLAM